MILVLDRLNFVNTYFDYLFAYFKPCMCRKILSKPNLKLTYTQNILFKCEMFHP